MALVQWLEYDGARMDRANQTWGQRMYRLGLCLLFMFSWTAMPGGAVGADNRVALIIGNSAYRHVPELKNPKNDAIDMATALERLGFNIVKGYDLDKTGMDRTIRDFAATLSGADVGFLRRPRPTGGRHQLLGAG
jgi:hypothetical protein